MWAEFPPAPARLHLVVLSIAGFFIICETAIKSNIMILRIWHGYTTKPNADIYENLLRTEIFPEIESKKISGYRRMQLLRRELDDEVEFTTIMWFETLESVIEFVGDDYETVYVPEKARKILSRFDQKSVHTTLIETIDYNF